MKATYDELNHGVAVSRNTLQTQDLGTKTKTAGVCCSSM